MLTNILDLVRIKDWLKNIILFFPLIFSGQVSQISEHINIFSVFLIFCLSASIIYIINDIIDLEVDRIHPLKKIIKPLASNRVSLDLARKMLIFIFIILVIFLFFNKSILFHVLAYLFINLTYNFYLKKIPIIDIISLAFGYVIRLDAGSNAIEVITSNIMIFTIFFLALFVLSIKRLKEYLLKKSTRSSLKFYSKNLLQFLTIISGTSFLFFYLAYIIYKNNYLIISFPLVCIILLRYYKIALKKENGEFPIDLVIKDKLLLSLSFLTLTIIIVNFI